MGSLGALCCSPEPEFDGQSVARVHPEESGEREELPDARMQLPVIKSDIGLINESLNELLWIDYALVTSDTKTKKRLQVRKRALLVEIGRYHRDVLSESKLILVATPKSASLKKVTFGPVGVRTFHREDSPKKISETGASKDASG